jgi:hypothetical protein
VNITNAAGTNNLGDGSGTDLSPTAGNVAVDTAGTDNVSATCGPAIDVTSTGGASLAFDEVDSTNSANDGINLDGLGNASFSADANSTIAGATGIAFDLNGGNGTVDFNGTINNGQGSTAEITGRSGGNVSLDGPINESGDADSTAGEDGGITLGGNTGGLTALSSTTKNFNTGEDNAIVMGTSDGHTLTAILSNLAPAGSAAACDLPATPPTP